jgi:RNA recognition motif-containing protein
MEQDLQRLVADIGGLISCKVFFDSAGRSKGEAELVFTTLQQAKSAIERYNESSVEGLKMQMELGEAPARRPRSGSDSDRRPRGLRRLGGGR